MYSKNMEEHTKHLRIVLKMLWEHHLYAKFSNCDFYNDQIQYLRHVISTEEICVDPEKIKTIMKWKVIKNVADIRSFMGLVGYYQQFINGFSKMAFPITSL